MFQRLLLQMFFSMDFVITDHPAKQEKQRKCRYPYYFADDEITENCAGHLLGRNDKASILSPISICMHAFM